MTKFVMCPWSLGCGGTRPWAWAVWLHSEVPLRILPVVATLVSWELAKQ